MWIQSSPPLGLRRRDFILPTMIGGNRINPSSVQRRNNSGSNDFRMIAGVQTVLARSRKHIASRTKARLRGKRTSGRLPQLFELVTKQLVLMRDKKLEMPPNRTKKRRGYDLKIGHA